MTLFEKIRHSEKMIFILVGASAAAVHESVMIMVVECFGVNPSAANLLGFFVAFFCSYLGHKKLTFKSSASINRSILKFFSVAALSFLCHYVIFYFLVYVLGTPYYVALPVALLIVAVLTFYISKRWVFKQ